MFLPSQLLEIQQAFRPDVEDLQVLLQEEGLPVGSAECLQELATRLNSDPRFRRDVAFMVRSLVGRAGSEAGSMDVLGVLVVAAVGTRQDVESSSAQQALRELLRFVIQQRRPVAAPEIKAAAAVTEGRELAPIPISPPLVAPRERPSPAPLPSRTDEVPIAEHVRFGIDDVPAAPRVQFGAQEVAVAPEPVAVPSLVFDEPESSWWREHANWVVAVVAVLIFAGAALVILRGGDRGRAPQVATTARSAASSGARAVAEPEVTAAPERRVILPPSHRSARRSRKAPARVTRAARVPAEPPRISAPMMAANTPPKTIQMPGPGQSAPKLNLPPTPPTVQQARPQQEPPASVGPHGNARGAGNVGNIFAHPEAAAAAAADQVPPPAFHTHDPVLIARNTPPALPGKPELSGTVHTGSTGTMASALMYSPDPEYPAEAIAAGVAGEVTVRAVVGPDGNVIDARVVSGPPLLREAALDAVGRWRFRPYEQNGKPVSIATTAIFDFQIPPGK